MFIFCLFFLFIFLFFCSKRETLRILPEEETTDQTDWGYGEKRLPIAARPQISGYPRSITANAVQPIRPPFSFCKSASAFSSFNTKHGLLSNASGNIWFLRRGSCRETSAVHQHYWAAILRPKINQPSSRYDVDAVKPKKSDVIDSGCHVFLSRLRCQVCVCVSISSAKKMCAYILTTRESGCKVVHAFDLAAKQI